MKCILIFVISVLFGSNIFAQPFSLDTTFNVNYTFNFGGIGGEIRGSNYEQDGKMMIYGSFWDGIHNISDVLRIYEDGSLDNTWQFMGSGASERIGYVKHLNNEYILFATSGSLGKFTYYGQNADTAWINNVWRGNICHGFYQPYIFSDGSMLVGTDSICNIESNKKRWFMKFFSDGTVDTNFKHSPNGYVFGVVKYSSDKLLLYGGSAMHGFTRYDSTQINRMCRIDTLGNIDTTFKSIFTGGSPRPLYVQNDGKIIVGAFFNIINYPSTLYIVRLNLDGSLDSTFNNFNSVNDVSYGVSSICPTTDGAYLIGGGFTQYQGYTRNNIVKTDANGYIDTAYFNGQDIDSVFLNGTPYVLSIVKGTNDTYYVMGYFTHYNGVHVNPIIRIHGLSVGINEVEKENVKVYPNPTINSITFNTGMFKDFKLRIFNAIGQIVLQKKLITSNTTLNIESFQRGMYYFQLINDKAKVISGKFVKE
ncbi:MAG: T9SS type A sorting domain-containing protein [Bacteroidetes bacterium]|nr:T9SS type A sorting domain-containing protein [Bacteroidota bacterium]